MAPITIMSVIGSAVPAPFRELGLLVVWYLTRNGETISGPLTSLSAAQSLACQLQGHSLHA